MLLSSLVSPKELLSEAWNMISGIQNGSPEVKTSVVGIKRFQILFPCFSTDRDWFVTYHDGHKTLLMLW